MYLLGYVYAYTLVSGVGMGPTIGSGGHDTSHGHRAHMNPHILEV